MNLLQYEAGIQITDITLKYITLSPAFKYIVIFLYVHESGDFRNLVALRVRFQSEDGDWYPCSDEENIPIWGRVVGDGGRLYIKAYSYSRSLQIQFTPLYTDYNPYITYAVYEILDEGAVL